MYSVNEPKEDEEEKKDPVNLKMAGGGDIQRKVNLSPGAAPETSCLSSRICRTAMHGMGQRRAKKKMHAGT